MRTSIFCLLLLVLGCVEHAWGSAAFSSSIEIKKGFIVLDAHVDGKPGHYILDSGAPGLILNRKYFNTSGQVRNNLHGLHGSVEVSICKKWLFEWNNYSKTGAEAMAIDLTYLENAIGEKIDGLIGIDVFEGYHVVVDYARNNLQLWSTIPKILEEYVFMQMDLQMETHVPVVTLWHEGRPLRFAFDSGSGAHILDQTIATRLTQNQVRRNLHIVGADQQVMKASAISISGLKSNRIVLPPTEFILTVLSHVRKGTDLRIDGILGQPFFEDRIIIFDRNRKSLQVCALPQEWLATKDQLAQAGR